MSDKHTPDIDEMSENIEKLINESGLPQDPGFKGTVKGLFGKMTKSFIGMFDGPVGQHMYDIYVSSSKELLLQKLGEALQEFAWSIVTPATEEVAKTNRAVRWAFHTSVGKAACTFLVFHIGMFAALWAAEYMAVRGKNSEARYLRLIAKVFVYSAGSCAVNSLNMGAWISKGIDGIKAIAKKEGIDIDKLAEEEGDILAPAKA